ncbi:MurR/RpiR family transcriptional regulator [Mesoplasma photuris]|uniref:MurR/RpiR family transcriptional regulator n=1 Tax=Mesoplasma photuris TaxID=217731 RepID=UPI0004E1DFA4|nr:MurR/RpiR family transcriptional regulator [Mesoplasma photuris]
MDIILKRINKIIADGTNGDTNVSIAKFILDNLNYVSAHKTSEIADKCNVAPSSIIRFCKIIGLEGINELKFIIKKSRDSIKLSMEYDEYFEKYLIAKNNSAALLNENFLDIRENIIRMFAKKRNIHIFCFNIAFFATKGFVQRMRKKQYSIFLEDDISSIQSYIDVVKEEDLVIFVSLSGENHLLEGFSKSLENKCETFAILGKDTEFKNVVDEYFILENTEEEFWDLFSIRSQTLQQFWDYVFLES